MYMIAAHVPHIASVAQNMSVAVSAIVSKVTQEVKALLTRKGCKVAPCGSDLDIVVYPLNSERETIEEGRRFKVTFPKDNFAVIEVVEGDHKQLHVSEEVTVHNQSRSKRK